MSKPQFEIKNWQRTPGGSLPTSIIQQVGARLLQRGLVLLPSDTCYSLAAIPVDESIRNKVNAILGRRDEPISLAFSSFLHVQQYVQMDNTIALLLERFTPGPITIVCKAKGDVPEEFLSQYIGSTDRTIGVRIPDSFIERDVAASTKYPLMTIAVRDVDGEPVRVYEQAVEIVGIGIKRIGGGEGWTAIEPVAPFHASHSTVIRVGGPQKVELLRQGDIDFEEIQDAIQTLSGWAVEEWS